jgi:hypothetical protein
MTWASIVLDAVMPMAWLGLCAIGLSLTGTIVAIWNLMFRVNRHRWAVILAVTALVGLLGAGAIFVANDISSSV